MLKVAMQKMDPVFFAFCRDVGTSTFLLCMARRFEQKTFRFPRSSEMLAFASLGLTGVAGCVLFMGWSMMYISPLNASLYQPLQPIFVVLLSIFPFRVKSGLALQLPPTLQCVMQVVGLSCAVCGAIYVPIMKGATGGDTLMGNMLILISVSMGSVFQILNKLLLESWEPISRTAWTYVFGALFVGFILPFRLVSTDQISQSTIVPLLYTIVLTSGFNYVAMAWVNQRSGPAMVTAFLPLQVVTTAILDWLCFGGAPTTVEVIGGFMIVGGLLCISIFSRVVAKPPEPHASKVEPEADPIGKTHLHA